MGKNLVVTGVASPWNGDIALTLKLLVQLDELRLQVREGAEYFTAPAGAAQRRYEALRAYFTEDMPASEVADRFGYSTASVHQMATLLRKGKLALFTEGKPDPKGPRKATGQLPSRVLELRSPGIQSPRSLPRYGRGAAAVGADLLAGPGSQGLPRLARRDEGRRGPPARLEAVKSAKLHGWPEDEVSLPCDHAGLLLLFPAIAQLGLPGLVRAAVLPLHPGPSSWQSVGTLLLAKCARKARIHHAAARR